MIRALLGGSFDPVHDGHVAMANHVLARGLAGTVHVVPAWRSPHKTGTGASAAERLAMVRLAFPVSTGIVIDDREVRAGRACFTVDTLAALVAAYPEDTWRLVVGADNLATFPTWHRPDEVLELAELLVLGRAGWRADPAGVAAANLPPDRVILAPEFDEPVSSTAVRDMLAGTLGGPDEAARLVAGGLPEPVAAHIVSRGLYRPATEG